MWTTGPATIHRPLPCFRLQEPRVPKSRELRSLGAGTFLLAVWQWGTPQNYNLSGGKKSETISNHHGILNKDRTGYNGHLYNWVDVKKTWKKVGQGCYDFLQILLHLHRCCIWFDQCHQMYSYANKSMDPSRGSSSWLKIAKLLLLLSSILRGQVSWLIVV